MARLAVDIPIGSLATYVYPGGYDSTKLGLGPLMRQDSSGFVGPYTTVVGHPVEQTTNVPSFMPWAMQWSSTIDWIFLADQAAAGTTRRINYYTYNRSTGVLNWAGCIITTPPSGTNHTIRALRMTYDLHTVGTVAVTGTTVTGTSTKFSTDRACVGNRIGFGSTDPTQIVTWYEISAIGSDSSITLTTSAGTIGSGSTYVIEDLRAVTLNTAATTTNGGMFVTKGLRPEIFIQTTGTTVAAATTVDNARFTYWLADASTVTNITGFGLALPPVVDKQTQYAYALDTVANPVCFKYNLRAALSLTAGKDTTSLVFKTGSGGALSGTASQVNNARYASTNHGPGNGLNCIYFTTTTKIYRTNDVSTFSAASTTWVADSASEIPPGGVNTFAASSLMNCIEYSSLIDRFVIAVNATTTPFRSYLTQYRTDAGQFDQAFGLDNRQIDQTTVDSTTTPVPTLTGGPYTIWETAGLCYLAGIGTTAITNRLYVVPLLADWEYASVSNCRVVFPAISTPNANKYVRAYACTDEIIGTGTSGHNLGLPTEAYRMYYRTSGISDNSGSWTLLGDSHDLTGVAGASQIQLMAEFRMLGPIMIPARLLVVGVVYDDLTTDSHYQPSATLSSASTKKFAWRFSTAFGTTVPALRVRLIDAVSGGVYVDDNTGAPTGTFEASTNGGSTWSAWTNADKGNDTTYLRYTPASLGDNLTIRALLTLN